jgi:hypothetical protein
MGEVGLGSMQTSSYHKFGHIEYKKTTNPFATVKGSNADKAPFSIWIVVEFATRLARLLCSNNWLAF